MEALHLPYIRCILCVREGMVHSNEWRLYIFLTLDMYLCVRGGGMVVMSGGFTPSLH